MTAPYIFPSSPRINDDLVAKFDVDGFGANATCVTHWDKFVGGTWTEQWAWEGMMSIPAGTTLVGEQWRFRVKAFNFAGPGGSYQEGAEVTSNTVTIAGTAPEILSLMINSDIMPASVSGNPTINWVYRSLAGNLQTKFKAAIGTKQPKVNGVESDWLSHSDSGVTGIIMSIPTLGADVSLDEGDDVMDYTSDGDGADSHLVCVTSHQENMVLGPLEATMEDYTLALNGETMILEDGQAAGNVSFQYSGSEGLFQLNVILDPTDKQSTMVVSVDGNAKSTFVTSGEPIHPIGPLWLNDNSVVVLACTKINPDSMGAFNGIQVNQFDAVINASDFASSGTLTDYQPSSGFLALTDASGSATIPFWFPTGTYDIDVYYSTTTTAGTTLALSVNGIGQTPTISIPQVAESSEISTVIQTYSAVSVTNGWGIQLAGNGGAGEARVLKVVFRNPAGSVICGRLLDGYTYYASTSVYDGSMWSDWYVTKFTMSGSAWSSVSNSTGWTIEVAFKVVPKSTSSGTQA